MSSLFEVHDDHDATYQRRGGRRVVAEYGRPDRAHKAVRNVAGLIEVAADAIEITGEDRVDFVDNAISNRVPTEDGRGRYALLLTPQGRIRTEMYVFNAGTRLLLFLPPGEGEDVAAEWRENTFIQDVSIETLTEELTILGVHGAQATEKIASVFSEQTPDEQLTFVRGVMGDAGVTVIRTDGLTGEEGYDVVCSTDVARDVYDTLENRGLNAAPFGYRTWESLTLEAGTPLFESELREEVPNNLGLRNAVDFEKGCFVGQEVVSRVENRGEASKQLVGLTVEAVPEGGGTVYAGDETVGSVTRGVQSPSLEEPIALALLQRAVATALDDRELTVRIDGEEYRATGVELPFVDGSERSARLPSY